MKKEGERYDKIFEQMELLGIQDTTTNRQHRNGTVVWQLPIKNHNNRNPSYIEVASFSTGYVRNQNSGYSNYQLNKRCEGEPEYFQLDNGDYRKFSTRSCVLIPNEIDRLEYLITYCLKNYYIKRANQVAEGSYVSKWYHEWELERNQNKMEEICHLDANASNRINDLEAKLTKVRRECNHAYDCGLSDGEKKANETYGENTGAMKKINELKSQLNHNHDFLQNVVKEKKELESKLIKIERIARINASYR